MITYKNIFLSLFIISGIGFNNSNPIHKNELLGKWEFFELCSINSQRFDQKFDRIKITQSNIEFYKRNFKTKNLIFIEKIKLNKLKNKNFNTFEVISDNNIEYLGYHLDSTKTRLRILKIITENVGKKVSILNRLNNGYFYKVE